MWTYPQGEGAYGVMDMRGNVWEWQNNFYDKDHVTRLLRGGSWCECYFGGVSYSRLNALFFNGIYGSSWDNCIGFRLASLPVSQG